MFANNRLLHKNQVLVVGAGLGKSRITGGIVYHILSLVKDTHVYVVFPHQELLNRDKISYEVLRNYLKIYQ
jgi:hypothetical protein